MRAAKRERNAAMIALYQQGWSLARIGSRYGICDMRVWQILKREGVKTRPRRGAKAA